MAGDKKVSDLNKINATKKPVDWEILAIFIGIIMTVPMLALLGSAIYAIVDDRPGAYVGILLTIIIMLVFWAIIWMGIGMFSGLSAKNIFNLINKLLIILINSL